MGLLYMFFAGEHEKTETGEIGPFRHTAEKAIKVVVGCVERAKLKVGALRGRR